MKSICIRSFFGPYFPTFGLNTDQKNLEYGHVSRSVADNDKLAGIEQWHMIPLNSETIFLGKT